MATAMTKLITRINLIGRRFALATMFGGVLFQGCALNTTSPVNAPDGSPGFTHGITAPREGTRPPAARLINIGDASWYGPGFHGKKTASGAIFDDTKFTAAHKTLPLGSKVRVTNLANGRSVEVDINDRGPFIENRVIDVSQAAAYALGMRDRGVARVRVELVDSSIEQARN